MRRCATLWFQAFPSTFFACFEAVRLPSRPSAARGREEEGGSVMGKRLFAAVLFAFAFPAGAATHFVAESRDVRLADSPVQTSVLWLDGAHLRLEADETHTVIYRADEDVAWVIDHRDKSYRTIDRETAETVAQGVGQANTAARRYIEMLPPAQRQAAERLLDQTFGSPSAVSPDIEVRASGANTRIAGVSCALYEVRRGAERRAEVCRSTFEAAAVGAQTRDALRALADTLGGILPTLAPEHLRQDGIDALHAFSELDGVPLRVRLYEDGSAIWETLVTEVVERAAPATAFELPDGYERRLAVGGRLQRPPAEPSP
jgi:hypothetical protein